MARVRRGEPKYPIKIDYVYSPYHPNPLIETQDGQLWEFEVVPVKEKRVFQRAEREVIGYYDGWFSRVPVYKDAIKDEEEEVVADYKVELTKMIFHQTD